MAWRASKNRAYLAAERQPWEREHPGEEWPEHLCGLSEADYVRYQRWEERWRGLTAAPREGPLANDRAIGVGGFAVGTRRVMGGR